MNNRKGLVILALAILLIIVVFANRGRVHFDWTVFWQQVRHIRWPHIAAGVGTHLCHIGCVRRVGQYFSPLRRRYRLFHWWRPN